MTDAALDPALNERIQLGYRTWLGERAFNARRGQREMIASIARVLTRPHGERRIAAIPIAQTLGKRLVIATATVALQEQIVLRDLPDLVARSGLEFNSCFRFAAQSRDTQPDS